MAQTTIKNRQIAGGLDGWIPAEETWTYASADDPTFTFTVAADVTTKYSAGMKIKLTQGTVKYFIITAVSTYSGGNTTITVYGGTDYDLASSAISANAYSMMKSPQGFPMSPAKWSVVVSYASQADTASTTFVAFDTTNLKLDVPVGSWRLSWKGVAGVLNPSGTEGLAEFAFSSGQTSISDTSLHHYLRVTGASSAIRDYKGVYMVGYVDVASKTSYYLIGKLSVGNSCYVYGQNSTTVLRATCAYL